MLTNFILLEASSSGSSSAGGGWVNLLMIGALILIFYFFMIRPQSQKQKKVNAFRASLKNGDKVMTAGGIYGRIRDVKDEAVILEIADGVRIKVSKASIYETVQDAVETGQEIQK